MPDTPPRGFPIPIRLGERVVGWAAADLAGPCVADTPGPLVVVPIAGEVLAVRTGRRAFTVIPQASITYVTSLGGVVTVQADTGRHWRDGTLADTAARLDPRRFLRLDASHVVNVARIAELVPWTHQRYVLRFADAAKTELTLSRDVGRRLRAVMGW